MGIHMDLDYHEPPDGDFVRLIDTMVGAPPHDPEATGKEITEQLKARTKRNLEMVEQVGRERDASTPASWNRAGTGAGTSTIGGPPDIADALESMARTGLRGIAKTISGLLIMAGIAVFAVTVFLPGTIPLEPSLGVGLFFVGIVIRNAFA